VIGNYYYRHDDFDQGLRAFKSSLRNRVRKALEIKPEENSYIYNLGNALYDQGKYKLAIKEYQKVTISDKEIYDLAQKNIQQSKKKLNK